MTIECCEGMSGFTEIHDPDEGNGLRVFDLALLLVWEAPFPSCMGTPFCDTLSTLKEQFHRDYQWRVHMYVTPCTRLMLYALYPYVNSGKEDSKRYWGIPFNDQNGCFCDRVLGSECKLLEVRKWVKYSKPPANRDSGTFFPPDFAWRDNQYFSSISRRRDNQRELGPVLIPNERF